MEVPRPAIARSLFVAVCFFVMVTLVPACNAQQMPEQSLADTIDALKTKASDRPVRVLVKVKSEPAGDISAAAENKSRLTEIMRQAGAYQVEPIEGQPLLVMELSADQLDKLLASELVEAVQEDKPEGLY